MNLLESDHAKPLFILRMRRKILVNTDPQRRCYSGCHFSSEWRWGEWEVLQSGLREVDVERKLRFWRELNDYAVSQRGELLRSLVLYLWRMYHEHSMD